MKALILIQDELITKCEDREDKPPEEGGKKPEDRMIVLCIAYHNIAVEQEFLKQVSFYPHLFAVPSSVELVCQGSTECSQVPG